MKNKLMYIIAMLLLSLAIVSCKSEEDTLNYENKVFMEDANKVTPIPVKMKTTTAVKMIRTAIAKRAEGVISLNYKVDESLVAQYNITHNGNAEMLPANLYQLSKTDASIVVGEVMSSPIYINFKNLNEIDKQKTYILPITIASTNGIDILESRRTMYYVVQSSPTINTAAHYVDNAFIVDWKNPAVCNNLPAATLEVLFYCQNIPDKRNVGLIGTYEGGAAAKDNWFVRYESGNLQVFWTNSSNNLAYSTPVAGEASTYMQERWIHVAVVYDKPNSLVQVYIDGELKRTIAGASIGTINMGVNRFWLGCEYEVQRFIPGYISECRIWKTARTADEIKNNIYEVEPDANGLVAYWKLDDGDGRIAKDYTGNGNDAIPASTAPMKWAKVSLPQ